jgi:1-acyl-sn-glycerol-3-phosphate acyltransferase
MMLILRLPFSILRGVLISLLMLTLGDLYILGCLFIGYPKTAKIGLSQLWGRLFLMIVSSRLVVSGKENIPKDQGGIYIFSHSSYLDIPVLCASKPGQINFAASDFLLAYPVLGFIMKTVQAIVVYRKDPQKSIEQYKLAEKRVAHGESFMISPEGGRSNGEEILPFKSGPFILAMNAKAPLVPVVVYGAHKVWPKADKLPNMRKMWGKIYIEYLPPVSTDDFTDDNRKEKAELIRQDMEAVLLKMQKKKHL